MFFWQRLQRIMDKHTGDMNGKLDAIGRHIAGMEGRSNIRVDNEMTARKDENAAMTDAMQDPTSRVAELERRPKTDDDGRSSSSTWRASQVILGGWPRDTEKEGIERQALEWIHCLPENERGAFTKPYAPRKLGSIAKVRVDPAHLTQMAFRWQLALEARAQQGGQQGPVTWAAVERSPEMGQRRRRIRCAAEFLQRQAWGLTDPANSHVYAGRIVVARLARDAPMWAPAAVRQAEAQVPWETFRTGLCAAL